MDGTVTPQGGFVRSLDARFPRNDDIMPPRVRHALRQNTYELKEIKSALRVTRADDVVMELGGGVGFVSTVLSVRRALKHVHVFEANSALVDYIRQVHAANGIENATVHHGILGKRKSKVDFHVRKSLVGSSLDKMDGTGILRTEQVDVINVRSQMRKIKPTVLICDIEGAEVDLIPLMDLSTVRAAVIELHPQWIGPEGVNTVFQAFMAAGLAYFPKLSNQKVVTFRRNWPLK